MSAEDAEEYTAALSQVMAGGWRQIALARRLGVPKAIGMTTEAWVSERIGGYVRLSLDERREAVKALTDPDGEFQLSQREAGEVLGIGTMTVNRDLHAVPDGTGEASPLDEAQPSEPTASDVAGSIAETWDDEAASADMARHERLRTMRNARIGWLRFVSEHTPGELVEDMGLDEIREVRRDLGRIIGWLEQAREVAAKARGPRRISG